MEIVMENDEMRYVDQHHVIKQSNHHLLNLFQLAKFCLLVNEG